MLLLVRLHRGILAYYCEVMYIFPFVNANLACYSCTKLRTDSLKKECKVKYCVYMGFHDTDNHCDKLIAVLLKVTVLHVYR